jgi:hypothetical protein
VIAVPLVIAATVSAAAILIASAFLGGWHVRGLATASRCACGHAFGMSDKYTGACTATVIETNYVYGIRRSRKRVLCACKQHRAPGLSVAEPLDREFAEGASAS